MIQLSMACTEVLTGWETEAYPDGAKIYIEGNFPHPEEQNALAAFLYRASGQTLTLSKSLKLAMKQGVCINVAQITKDSLAQLALRYDMTLRDALLIFGSPVLQCNPYRASYYPMDNKGHLGVLVGNGSPYYGFIDVASYLFGLKKPTLAVGTKNGLSIFLSHLYSTHYDTPFQVSLQE